MKEGERARQTDALGRESARTFDARYHQRGLPTRVEAARGARDRGAAVGGIWGLPAPICPNLHSSMCSSRASPIGCLSGNRARGAGACGVLADGNTVPVHLPPRTKEDAARLRKSFQGPAPGAACPIFSLRVRHGPEEGRFGDYFMP